MKSRILKIGISSILFIALVFASLMMVRPVIHSFESSLVSFRDSVLQQIEERTGLRISYKSLSPSILSSFRIKGIVVYDAFSGLPLLEVERATLSYRIGELLQGRFSTAFTKLMVSGVTVEYNAALNKQLLEKLMSVVSDGPNDKSASIVEQDGNVDSSSIAKELAGDATVSGSALASGENAGVSDDVSTHDVTLSLPFGVEVRDVSVHYADDMVDALVTIKKIMLEEEKGSAFLNAAIDGKVGVTLLPPVLAKLPAGVSNGLERISGSFSVDAAVTPDLNGSSALMKLFSVKSDGYSLARTSFLAEYNAASIRVSTMQDALPFSVLAEFDTRDGGMAIRVDMHDFDPFKFVVVKDGPDILDKINGTTLSGSYRLGWDMKGALPRYSADGSVKLPASLLPGGAMVSFDVVGDTKDVSIRSFNVSSSLVDFIVEGEYNIPTMRPSGTAFLEKLVVPGGGVVSAEAYIDPLDQGFVCFIPQLYLDERSFTALQLTVIPDRTTRSVDFAFELSDYSHIEFGSPGVVSVAGSLIGGEAPYAQARVSINDLFIDTVVDTAAFFAVDGRESLRNAARATSPFMTTSELYVATDFSSVTYNAPYWIVANTDQDQDLLVFSFTGNESNISLSQFDLLYGRNSVQLSADVGLDLDFGSAFFTADATVNSIPYALAGSFMPENGLNITGSYGLDLSLAFLDETQGTILDGRLSFQEFPVALGKAVLLCSTDLSAQVPLYDVLSLTADIKRLSISEASGLISFNPTLALSGKVNSFGLMLDSFVYSDSVSLLNGSGGLMWVFSSGLLESATLNLSLASAVSNEAYVVAASVSNPDRMPFSLQSLMSDFYFSAQIDVEDFPMSRVRQMQADTDVCSGSVTAMGTAENPYVAVVIEPSSMSFGGVPFAFSGSALLDDGEIYLDNADITFSSHSVSGVSGHFSLPAFAGTLSATYDGAIGSLYTVHAPINVLLSSSALAEGSDIQSLVKALSRGVPDFVEMQLDMELGGSLFENPQPVGIDIVRMPGYIAVSSDDDLGVSGSIASGGNISLRLDGRMPIHANVNGTVHERQLDIDITDINCDLAQFKSLFYFPFIALHGGVLTGDVHMGGILADPDFNGLFNVATLTLNCPDYVPEYIVGRNVRITMTDNELKVSKAPFVVKDGGIVLDLSLTLDRWRLDLLSLQIQTPRDVFIPAVVNIPPVLIKGMSTCDLDIAVTMNSADVRGRFYTENLDIEVLSDMLQTTSFKTGKRKDFRVTLDIDVTTGQHAEMEFNPLLRGLIAPNTNVAFQFDSSTKDFSVKSDITLRGGEITYLNRNFYLREGRVVLDETGGSFDPRLTVRAEIRERDENGEPVRITLSAENQRLSEFNPSYSSSPARSELEIMTMLGQAVTGDIQSGWDVLLTGVDYGFQVFVLRKVENALRDLLNFDIFSLRTMGLQNSLRQWLDVGSDNKTLTISNFLDNTTVYIGKYFGSSIYADALFHFAYDETKVSAGESVSGLVFQPEIGLEMDSPFGTIRWSMAPEIGTTQHLWVPATSITLSWKFVF